MSDQELWYVQIVGIIMWTRTTVELEKSHRSLPAGAAALQRLLFRFYGLGPFLDREVLDASEASSLAQAELTPPAGVATTTLAKIVDERWQSSLLDIADYLGSAGASESLYVEAALELEFGAGARWHRRLSAWGRSLLRRPAPERAEERAQLRSTIEALVDARALVERARATAPVLVRGSQLPSTPSYERARIEKAVNASRARATAP